MPSPLTSLDEGAPLFRCKRAAEWNRALHRSNGSFIGNRVPAELLRELKSEGASPGGELSAALVEWGDAVTVGLEGEEAMGERFRI